jgi:hypothetical protein
LDIEFIYLFTELRKFDSSSQKNVNEEEKKRERKKSYQNQKINNKYPRKKIKKIK